MLVGFSEAFVRASSDLALLGTDGATLAERAQPTADPTELSLPLPALPNGVYTVAWHTVSAADGDPAKGYFAFVVGDAQVVAGSGETFIATQANVSARLTIAPLRAGANTYTVVVPVANVTRVRLRITPLDRDIGQSEIVLPAEAGSFRATGLELPFAGRYHVQVQVRRSDTIEDLAFEYDLAVPGAPSPSPAATPSDRAAPSPTPGQPVPTPAAPIPLTTLLVGAALAILAAGVAIALARRRR